MKSILFAVIVFFVLNTYGAAGQEVVRLPDLVAGDCWEFEGETRDSNTQGTDKVDGQHRACFNGKNLEVVTLVGDHWYPSSVSSEIEQMLLPGEYGYLKKEMLVPDAKGWTAHYKSKSGQSRSMAYVVKGKEQHEGKEVVVIEGTGQASARRGGATYTQARKIFYSPADKSIVHYFYDSAVGDKGEKATIILKKFSPGPGRIAQK
jgi:hypothetical protein